MEETLCVFWGFFPFFPYTMLAIAERRLALFSFFEDTGAHLKEKKIFWFQTLKSAANM